MKAATLSGFSPVILGGGLAVKIIAAAVVLATMAGGAYYALTQKSYAPETIQFDGRAFYLVGEIEYPAEKEGVAGYAATYTDATDTEREADAQWNLKYALFHYQVWVAANPASEWVRNGVFSPVAYFENLEDHGPHPREIFREVRKNGEELSAVEVVDTYPEINRLLVSGIRAGAAQKNAFVRVNYLMSEQYETPREWLDAKGAASIKKMFSLLAEYPLTHNETLLADMAEAVQ